MSTSVSPTPSAQIPERARRRRARPLDSLAILLLGGSVVTQLADRTEVIKKAVEDPAFRRAVRDANRERGRDLEERASAR